MPKSSSVPDEIACGLRNYWYPVFPTAYLQVAPTLTAIYADDRPINEAQGATETARASEALLPQDGLLVQARRLYLKALQAQQ